MISAVAIAVDAAGNAYVTGFTDSTNFPTANPLQATLGRSGVFDAFVAKLNPAGSALVYSTYLGGSGDRRIRCWQWHRRGLGRQRLRDRQHRFDQLPDRQRRCRPRYGGGDSNAFVAKLNPAGSALVYSTYLGGSGVNDGRR